MTYYCSGNHKSNTSLYNFTVHRRDVIVGKFLDTAHTFSISILVFLYFENKRKINYYWFQIEYIDDIKKIINDTKYGKVIKYNLKKL